MVKYSKKSRFFRSSTYPSTKNRSVIGRKRLLKRPRSRSITTNLAVRYSSSKRLVENLRKLKKEIKHFQIVLSELAYVHFCVWQKVGCHSTPVAHKLIPVEKLNNGKSLKGFENVERDTIFCPTESLEKEIKMFEKRSY